MKGNVCYQKTDLGSETPNLFNKYVLKTTQIAGIMLKTDISVKDLKSALNVPSKVSELVNDNDFATNPALSEEIAARKSTDENLALLSTILAEETELREKNDAELQRNIANEQNSRESSVSLITRDITELQGQAHTHPNKTVIDGITSNDIDRWNSINEQPFLEAYIELLGETVIKSSQCDHQAQYLLETLDIPSFKIHLQSETITVPASSNRELYINEQMNPYIYYCVEINSSGIILNWDFSSYSTADRNSIEALEDGSYQIELLVGHGYYSYDPGPDDTPGGNGDFQSLYSNGDIIYIGAANTVLQQQIDVLDKAIAADNAIIATLTTAKTYLEDMCFSITDEFQRFYNALGITVYDGGIFGMEQNDTALDGGNFDGEPEESFDCGGFEPITEGIGAVLDGGTF